MELGLFGVMFILSIPVHAVSILNLVLAFGISSIYLAYFAHVFIKTNSSLSPVSRVLDAFEKTSSSVVNISFTLFLGLIVLVASDSFLFVVFYEMIFGMIIIGLIFSLIFFPILLSVFSLTVQSVHSLFLKSFYKLNVFF